MTMTWMSHVSGDVQRRGKGTSEKSLAGNSKRSSEEISLSRIVCKINKYMNSERRMWNNSTIQGWGRNTVKPVAVLMKLNMKV